jgi:hypothetical protein
MSTGVFPGMAGTAQWDAWPDPAQSTPGVALVAPTNVRPDDNVSVTVAPDAGDPPW